ncbi:unnamed protein product [Amaranthus hypochondriacus]
MNTSPSVNSPFSDLPLNIKTQILARLPVKTLLKCRAVCQSWRACIESPSFISKHRDLYNKEHSKNSHLLLSETSSRFCLQRVTNGQKLTNLAFRPPFFPDSIIPWIYGACNGLFLLKLNDICLWNPFLRKLLILPPCPIAIPFHFTNYVLGFSTSCDDYKVLAYRLHTISNGNEYEPAMAVYSLRNHLWIDLMNVDAWTSLRAPVSCDKYVYCGSIVYWFTEGNIGIIHSFDFNTEEYINIAVPEPLNECKNFVLFATGELLTVMLSSCILVLEKHDEEYTLRDWCLESWVQNVVDIIDEEYTFGANLFFVEKSNTFLIIGFWGIIRFFEVTSKKLEILRNEEADFLLASDYVETLALLTEVRIHGQ